ncbi:putative ephrin-receptor like [Phytophthora infestans]|uniref:Putative ephrin-receptor like n=1 Tax=Phytophthora infestans TaxID=4787 RepID=A0A8S9U7P8_PHYIN|nr:putative ephrin-receptor like [Phytophthora infestans]
MTWITRTACLTLLLVLSVRTRWCEGVDIMDMLAPFINLTELAEQAAKDTEEGGAAVKVVDRTYPLASVELDALMQMYRDCRTKESAALRTWCIGDGGDSYLYHEVNESQGLCPRGVTTHPCTGRVLRPNRSSADDDAEFLWPWKGLRCDAFTEPTTVTHIYLPGESLHCEIAKLDLSIMVSLEQLDLSSNQLFGDVPDWLKDMTTLRILNLAKNQLTGDIPTSIAGNDALEQINLSSNNLTASSLSFFDAFRRLQHLDISNNSIDLQLPRSVFASRFLRSINISHNAFHGVLPELPVFHFLESLDMSSNFLTGVIPPQLSLWGREDPHDPDENSSLAFVDMSNNMLTGDLPRISNQSALQRFNIHNNFLGGLVPELPLSLLELAKPADFDDNQLLCPMPAALVSSNLTCVCGDGYTVKLAGATVNTSSLENSDARGDWKHMVLASESIELCVPCPERSYANSSTGQKCRSCPPGSTPETSNGRADSCRFCLPGTFANESASRSCTPCAPGTFSASIGATSCDPCHPGEFAAARGSTSCTACAVGAISSSKGASECTPCPVGTYVDVKGEAECVVCPKDAYQDVAGSAECKSCPLGDIAPRVGHVKCSPCARGSFYDVNTKTCTLCSPGTFTAAAAQTECSECENGTVAEEFGSDQCLDVAAPGWGYQATMTTAQCAPGTFNDGKWRACQPCPPGTFTAHVGSRVCSSCAKGSFASSLGSSHCEMALPGSFVQSEGAIRAELCEPNHVAARNGSVECTRCLPPSLRFLPGGTECSLARPGEVYDHVKWPRLALDLTGVDLVDTASDRVSPFDVLIQAWTDTLTSFLGSRRPLHVLQVRPLSSSAQMTQIVVAVETISPVSTTAQAGNNRAKEVGDAVHQAAKAAQSALDDLLDELEGSSAGRGNQESDDDHLADLIHSSSFRDALVRQFGRANLFDGALSFSMVNVSMVEPPFTSTRAVACPPGTFFSVIDNERVCLPCVIGSYSRSSGALQCDPCPRRTFSSEKGLDKCKPCPLGSDAPSGASSCVDCSWFTYECEGFWKDLIVAVCVGAALLRRLYQKIQKLCAGDQAAQQQDESVALMTAVRTHGRTFDGVRYAPMGMVSADAMFGCISDT